MKKVLLISILFLSLQAWSQKYVTKNGTIRFFSESPAENIEAINQQVNSAYDAANGNFVFKVLIKSFVFEKALMQEHFNENYLESDKFPNATFAGKVTDFDKLDLSKDGVYDVMTEGKLTIHGVTKDVKQSGSFKVEGGKIHTNSKFMVKVADYDIKIPKTVVDNIAEEIEVTVDATLEKLN